MKHLLSPLISISITSFCNTLVPVVMHESVDFTATTMANSDAKRLYDDLLRKSGYNKLIRPVKNNSDTVDVKLGLRLSQLIDVVLIYSLF